MPVSPRPVWEDIAGADVLRALDPGRPDGWDAPPDVLVVGGGVIGLAVAAMCTRAGVGRVLLCERGRLAGGPSGSAAGGLSPAGHVDRPAAWRELAAASLELHWALHGEWDYGLRSIDLVVLPDLVLPDQAHVDPLRLAAALAARAGTIATGVTVTGIESVGDRVTRARTSHGDVAPGAVVFATGLAPDEAGPLDQSWVKGHLIATEPAPFTVEGILVLDEQLVVQLPDGRLVAGGTREVGIEDPDADPETVDRVRRILTTAVPAAADLAVTHAWCCFRPCAADELPMIDALPGLDNAWVAAGFYRTGLLMAPAVGRMVAEWVTGDATAPPPEFALGRRLSGAR